MHGPMNVKFPNNISKWQMEFNSAFKGLICPNISPSVPYIVSLSMQHFLKLEHDLSSIDDPNCIIFWMWKYSNRLLSVTNNFNGAFESSKMILLGEAYLALGVN
jgi:hypothetical protein